MSPFPFFRSYLRSKGGGTFHDTYSIWKFGKGGVGNRSYYELLFELYYIQICYIVEQVVDHSLVPAIVEEINIL